MTSHDSVHCLAQEVATRDRRFLPPASATDLYEQFLIFCRKDGNHETVPGYVAFLRVYKARWHKVMPFRKLGTHAKCTVRAKLSKLRKDAKTVGARKEARREWVGREGKQ